VVWLHILFGPCWRMYGALFGIRLIPNSAPYIRNIETPEDDRFLIATCSLKMIHPRCASFKSVVKIQSYTTRIQDFWATSSARYQASIIPSSLSRPSSGTYLCYRNENLFFTFVV